MIEPVPPVVPVNVTEQLPVASNMQVLALKEPPVVPAVKVKVTVPVGVFEAVVVSVTVAVMLALQFVAPRGMLQDTPATVVVVLSFLTVTVPEVPMLPL